MCLTHVNPVYCRLIIFSLFLYLQDTIWVWTTGRDISAVGLIFLKWDDSGVDVNKKFKNKTKTKKKKILVCLLCTFPFKSNNCFLFQVIDGTSFAPTCWTSNRDVLCSEPLLAGGEVQPAEGFWVCLLLGFHLKMFTNASAGSTTGRKEIKPCVFSDTLSLYGSFH